MKFVVNVCTAITFFGLLALSPGVLRAGLTSEEVKLFGDYMVKAEQGDPKAQVNVANSYYFGTGVEKNLRQALAWYRKAAEQGYDWGQVLLGAAYYGGEGVPKDFAQAIYWYR